MMVPAVDVVGPLLAPVLGSLKVALLGTGGVAVGVGFTMWCLKKMWLVFQDLIGNDRVRDMTWDYAGRISDMDAMAAAGSGGDESGAAGSGGYDAEAAAAEAASQNAAAISYLDRYRS